MRAPRSTFILGLLVTTAVLLATGVALASVPAIIGPADGPGLRAAATIDLTRHRGVIVEGDAGTRGSLSVACPSGTVVGGGFSHVGKDLQVIESRPDGIHAWQVSWVQSSDNDSVLYAYATCILLP